MRRPLTAREAAALEVLSDALRDGNDARSDSEDPVRREDFARDFEHYRRRLLRVLSRTWQRRKARTK